MSKCNSRPISIYSAEDIVYSMIKENEPRNKAVVLYLIDTEYNTNIRVITTDEFNKLCGGA